MTSCEQELRERLLALKNLNPDLTVTEVARIYELAGMVGKAFFPCASELAGELTELYLSSDIKRVGRDIMGEYFSALEQSARLLRDAGVINPPLPEHSGTFSTALVPREQTDALDFCRILNRSSVPKPLVKAADAFRRRNQIVESVLSYAFRVLWIIDTETAGLWMTELFEKYDGDLDPDIARDALESALYAVNAIPEKFLEWVLRFASDQNLLEYWPAVTKLADALLCNCALKAWRKTGKRGSTLLWQLKLYVDNDCLEDAKLLEWCKNALGEIGNSVQRFMALDKDDTEAPWKAAALMAELRKISELYVPVMLAADKLLQLPDGAEQLAMAFMGLSGQARTDWEDSILTLSFRIIKRTFMLDLRYGKTPVETIRKLTFGDQLAFNMAYGELDLCSEKFDSISQRDKVTSFLSVFYASYRRPQLLGIEIARRYRSLMKMVHEDFLGLLLNGEQLDKIRKLNILPEISSIAGSARKFLAKRKADENSLEEMTASKIAFERFIREKRIQVIRRCL